MLSILLRVLAFALAVFILWRVFREGYQKFKERFLVRRVKYGVVEPEVETFKRDSKTLLRVYLPGVMSERDISLRKLRESLEIRADGKESSFFKIVSIEPENSVKSKRFVPPVLEIEMA